MCRPPDLEPDQKASVYSAQVKAAYQRRFLEKNPNYFKDRAKRLAEDKRLIPRFCKRCPAEITGKGKKGSCQYCEKCRVERQEELGGRGIGKTNPNCLRCGADITKLKGAKKYCLDCSEVVYLAQQKKNRAAYKDRNPHIKSDRYPCLGGCGRDLLSSETTCSECRIAKQRDESAQKQAARVCKTCGDLINSIGNKAAYCKPCGKLNNKRLTAEWKIKNPGKEKARVASVRNRRRARERSCEGKLTSAEWQQILKDSEGKCSYCPNPGSSMDHVVPLSRGGAHSKENIVVACLSCNSLKGNKLLSEWHREEP